jgi:thiol:disulfide interchange protein
MAGGGYFCFALMYEPPHEVAHVSKVWPAFDLDKALEARAKGKTVVIDWTADW